MQPFPPEIEFELVKIYRKVDQLPTKSTKNILKKVIRNIYLSDLTAKRQGIQEQLSAYFSAQKKKIGEYIEDTEGPKSVQSREKEIRTFLASLGISREKIDNILHVVNS